MSTIKSVSRLHDHAADLILHLGTELALPPEEAILNSDDAICLRMQDGSPFFILFQPDALALDLYASLGELDPERTTELYVDMLQGNMLFCATDGACLGLDPQTEQPNLNARLPLEGLDYALFRDGIVRFLRTYAFWKERIAGRPPQAVSPANVDIMNGLRV